MTSILGSLFLFILAMILGIASLMGDDEVEAGRND